MERPDQGSPLPSDPAGREDIMSDEQAGRDGVSPAEPEGEAVRPGGEGSPLPTDPAHREDVIRDGGIRDGGIREDVVSDAERPGSAAAGD